jgi:1,2-dihydroxy-3-keto-5-methylthiopentene dioxygenase
MSILSVYHLSTPEQPNKTLTHVEDITSTLAAAGIDFAQLPLSAPVLPGSVRDAILTACGAQLDQVMSSGYPSLDLLSLDCGIGGEPERRASQRQACRYGVDQQFYCLGGRVQLCLQVDDYVLSLECTKHDLVRVPAGISHWLDIGEQPRLAVVRLFASSQVPAGELTEQALAERVPGLDD